MEMPVQIIVAPQSVPMPISTPAPAPQPVVSQPSSGCHSTNGMPDPTCTPGIDNPDITQATIGQTICSSSWTTKSIRPPVSYTTPLKIKQIGEYGYSDTSTTDYEEDHLIPLTVGGNPTDPKNLWPEPAHILVNGDDLGFREKDKVEVWLNRQVCSGAMTLDDARNGIAKDWVVEYRAMQAQQDGKGGIGVDDLSGEPVE